MGTIATTKQQDNTGCGFYAGYAVSLVNKFGYSPGHAMSNTEVESARAAFGSGSATLSEYDAARYLQQLGVVPGYTMSNPMFIPGVEAKVCESLDEGKALMWGSISHWMALLARSGETLALYDPGDMKGILTTVALEHVSSLSFLVHPASWKM